METQTRGCSKCGKPLPDDAPATMTLHTPCRELLEDNARSYWSTHDVVSDGKGTAHVVAN